ncbi:hypothetical protein E3N88_10095 [Mikania micrantha]|uniref:Uncharacterized protein n=1 Tax=Mikania micrantha TaxID=192012 RepID=A0A5N6PBG5_9ASTR|nr:hypothetical protein E3N88_10095 [Mikania micrantha]
MHCGCSYSILVHDSTIDRHRAVDSARGAGGSVFLASLIWNSQSEFIKGFQRQESVFLVSLIWNSQSEFIKGFQRQGSVFLVSLIWNSGSEFIPGFQRQ